MPTSVTYPGLANVLGADMTLSRGAYPSVATLVIPPQATLDLPPGNLTFTGHTGNQVTIQCSINTAFLKKRHTNDGWRWDVQLVDKRKDWEGATITGEHNKRVSSGLIPAS